jgi:hypothetical protein
MILILPIAALFSTLLFAFGAIGSIVLCVAAFFGLVSLIHWFLFEDPPGPP